MWEVEDASERHLDRLSMDNTERLCNIGTMLWAIWYFRNKKIWENRVVTPKLLWIEVRNGVQIREMLMVR